MFYHGILWKNLASWTSTWYGNKCIYCFWSLFRNGNTHLQEALGAVLVAGVLFLIISLTPIRAWLINSIPKSLKLGIGAGIGLFLAIIGFKLWESLR